MKRNQMNDKIYTHEKKEHAKAGKTIEKINGAEESTSAQNTKFCECFFLIEHDTKMIQLYLLFRLLSLYLF